MPAAAPFQSEAKYHNMTLTATDNCTGVGKRRGDALAFSLNTHPGAVCCHDSRLLPALIGEYHRGLKNLDLPERVLGDFGSTL
jgi:hypothetical protein